MNKLRLSLRTGDAVLNFVPDDCLSSIEFSEDFSLESKSTSSRSRSLPGIALLTRNETTPFGGIGDLRALPQPPLSRWDSAGTSFTTTSTQAVKEGQGRGFSMSNAIWQSKNNSARRSSAPDRAPSQTPRRTSFVIPDTAPKQTRRRTSIVAPDNAPRRTSRKSRLSWRKQLVESEASGDEQDESCSPPIIQEQITEQQAKDLGLKSSSSKEKEMSLLKQDKSPLRVRRQSTKSQASSRHSQPAASCRAA